MSNDTHVNGLLHDYLDGELTPRERWSVDAHIKSCAPCAVEFQQLQRVHQNAATLPKSIEPQRDLWPGIASGIRTTSRFGTVLNLVMRRNGYHAKDRPALGSSRTRPQAVLWPSLGAAAVIAAGVFGWSLFTTPAPVELPAWQILSVEGNPLIGAKRIEEGAHLHEGEWLETDGSSRAAIAVGSIGLVEVAPNTRVHLVDASADDHRLSLAEGNIRAMVSAPPRLFFVETPSAVAVDLGCAYALHVEKNGAGRLDVTTGWVALEARGRRAVVPAGMSCLTRPGSGPGTPFLDDAPAAFRSALEEYDFAGRPAPALESVLAGAREEDAITLWHLLFRVDSNERGRVYDRIAGFFPPPRGTTREGVLKGDPAMVSDWQEQLGLGSLYMLDFTQ